MEVNMRYIDGMGMDTDNDVLQMLWTKALSLISTDLWVDFDAFDTGEIFWLSWQECMGDLDLYQLNVTVQLHP